MAEQQIELNSSMMRNTYKIEGGGSLGTCFLVGRPIANETNRARFVLITAAHVLEQMSGETAVLHLRQYVNNDFTKIPHTINIRRAGSPLWVKNPQGIDVAAMYVELPLNADHNLLSTNYFATDNMLNDFEIHPGDELCCLGFPLGAEANHMGFPVLRSGRIASFPLVPTREKISFLLDFQVFRGNSGGPVYFVDSNRSYAGATHIGKIQFIAGLVSQEFSITETINSLYETKQQVHPLALAVIIHASHILDTINQLQ